MAVTTKTRKTTLWNGLRPRPCTHSWQLADVRNYSALKQTASSCALLQGSDIPRETIDVDSEIRAPSVQRRSNLCIQISALASASFASARTNILELTPQLHQSNLASLDSGRYMYLAAAAGACYCCRVRQVQHYVQRALVALSHLSFFPLIPVCLFYSSGGTTRSAGLSLILIHHEFLHHTRDHSGARVVSFCDAWLVSQTPRPWSRVSTLGRTSTHHSLLPPTILVPQELLFPFLAPL